MSEYYLFLVHFDVGIDLISDFDISKMMKPVVGPFASEDDAINAWTLLGRKNKRLIPFNKSCQYDIIKCSDDTMICHAAHVVDGFGIHEKFGLYSDQIAYMERI